MTASRPPARTRRLQSSTPAEGAAAALLAPAASTPAAEPASKPAAKQASTPAAPPASEPASKPASKRASTHASTGASTPSASALSAPRVRQTMRFIVPLSTRLAPDVREAVDAHIDGTGEAMVDLVDRALRMALGMAE